MWNHPVTEKHLAQCKEFFDAFCSNKNVNVLQHGTNPFWEHKLTNFHIVPPIAKKLACGDVDIGALANIDDICKKVQYALENKAQ